MPPGLLLFPGVAQKRHPGRLGIPFRPKLGGAMRQDQFHLLDSEAFAQFVGDALGAAGKPHQHRAMNGIEHDGPRLRTVFAFPGRPDGVRSGATGVVFGGHDRSVPGEHHRRVPESPEAGNAGHLRLVEGERFCSGGVD